MPTFIAKKTIYHTSTDIIASGEVFDSKDKGISDADIKSLLKNGDITKVPTVSKPSGTPE